MMKKEATETKDFAVKIRVPSERNVPLYIMQQDDDRLYLMHGDGDWYLLSIRVNPQGKMYFCTSTSVPEELGFLLDGTRSIVVVREGEDPPVDKPNYPEDD